MTDAERDARWARVETELRRLPRVQPDAIDRVMDAVHASEIEPAPARGSLAWLTTRSVAVAPWQLLAASLLLAAGVYALGVRRGAERRIAAVPTPVVAPAPVAAAGQPVQFVFVSPDAREVTLVGDFNDWNPRATRLARTPEGVWSIVLPLAPGRHVYSFVVDGAHWMPDASAPRAPEDEFGGGNSVVLVGSRS